MYRNDVLNQLARSGHREVLSLLLMQLTSSQYSKAVLSCWELLCPSQREYSAARCNTVNLAGCVGGDARPPGGFRLKQMLTEEIITGPHEG